MICLLYTSSFPHLLQCFLGGGDGLLPCLLAGLGGVLPLGLGEGRALALNGVQHDAGGHTLLAIGVLDGPMCIRDSCYCINLLTLSPSSISAG